MNVTKICKKAFASCYKLENFEITNNSKLKTIGKDAFNDSKIDPQSISEKIKNINYNCNIG